MFRTTIVLIALFGLATAGKVDFKHCKGKPAPNEVRIDGCDKQPCRLIRGKEANMETDFTAGTSTTTLEPKIMSTALGVTLPYELPEDRQNACDWLLGTACPIDEGEDVTYHLNMPILKIYPKVRVLIEVSLIDDSRKVISCFAVETVVVDA